MIARVPPPTNVDDLERFSEANPGWQIEREADGTITMSPTHTDGGWRNAELAEILAAWRKRVGGRIFDSSTGFTMPDGAILSPDGSWIASERWRAVPREERTGYVRIVPDVCIEIVSSSQTFEAGVRKALRYRGYGASYVLVLDPKERRVWSDGAAPTAFPDDFSRVIDDDPDTIA